MSTQTFSAPYRTDVTQCENIEVFGTQHFMLATGAQTGGSFTQFQDIVPPQGGPMPHVHFHDDETFFVLEGEFEFYVPGQVLRVGPGDYVYAPRGVPHQFRNVGVTTGKLLITVTPAGLEEFFAESRRILADDPTDMASIVTLAKRYGMELVSPDSL